MWPGGGGRGGWAGGGGGRRYVPGPDAAGRPTAGRDPLAARRAELAAEAGPDADRLASALFGLTAVFGDDLPRDPRFTAAVTDALRRLYAEGARAVVQAAAG